jgi:hypothetical protein
MQNKPNFLNTQINVSVVITKYYENIPLSRGAENKPNSNPIKPNSNPIKPNLPDAQMSVNSILTKDYEKNDIFSVPQNKANSNPNKPNLPDAKFFNKSDKPLLLMSRNISVLFVDEWGKKWL